MILAPLLLLALAQTCGTERWDVKTLTDARATAVDFTPVPVLVAQLTAIAAPPYSARNPRLPEERLVYQLTAYVLGWRIEEDGDLHVVLADSPRTELLHNRHVGSRDTMVIEFPSPDCSIGSPHHADQASARLAFLRLAGAPPEPGRFKHLSHPLRVLVSGVAFFDRDHGQTGRAVNALELHPVLAIGPAR